VRQRIAVAESFTDPDSPIYNQSLASRLTKSLLARTLGFSRYSWYYQPKLPARDQPFAEHIRRIYSDDNDTLGPKKLAKQITGETGKPTNHKRITRIMHNHEISARPRKARYVYPGKTHDPFTNLVRAMTVHEAAIHPVDEQPPEVFRSDILEGRLADGSKVRVAFAWRETTAQILSLVIDWRMQAELIVETLARIPEACTSHIQDQLTASIIWRSDQGSQYGSMAVIDELVNRNFIASMSRAGTPTDNGAAERLVGEFKHAVLRRMSYAIIGQLLHEAERWINYYNERRPHGRINNHRRRRWSDSSLEGSVSLSSARQASRAGLVPAAI
jgi:putative transposase